MSASITLIGALTETQIESLEAWLASYQITSTKKVLLPPQKQLTIERWELNRPFSESEEQEVRKSLLERSDADAVDYVYQKNSMDISKPGLAVFDMDSTLIKAEVIDELAVELGIGEQISAITASAMRGEIDFVESFTKRLSLLEGLSGDRMDSVFDRIKYMDGIETMMKVLNHYQWHTAILSGGFTFFAEKIQQRFHFSEVHANVLEIKEGKLTGKNIGPIVDAKRKKHLLETILTSNHIDPLQSIACGDGANDLLMLNTAALGVALHAKPLVRQQAPHPVNQFGLDVIPYLLGMTEKEISNLTL